MRRFLSITGATLGALLLLAPSVDAQATPARPDTTRRDSVRLGSADSTAERGFSGALSALLKPRLIGPAVTGGRISSVAVHPENPGIMYVGVASGGVFKTENGGATWSPMFDRQSSYSIG